MRSKVRITNVLRDAAHGFVEDHAMTRGAAIAFYLVTSLAPITMIVVALAGLIFGRDIAKHDFLAQIDASMGGAAAGIFRSALEAAQKSGGGWFATATGLTVLLAGSTGAFGEIHASLNAIWRARPSGSSAWAIARARLLGIALLILLGVLLCASVAATTAITVFQRYVAGAYAPSLHILPLVNGGLSLSLLTLLFAALFKILPDRPLHWGDVFLGAFFTACLFTIGKSLIGWYLAVAAIGSAYGAAGALIVILLWVYYSAQIFLFGAECTKAYALQRGSLVIAEENAPELKVDATMPNADSTNGPARALFMLGAAVLIHDLVSRRLS